MSKTVWKTLLELRKRIPFAVYLYGMLVGAAVFLFVDVAGDIYAKNEFAVDQALLDYANRIESPALTRFFEVVTIFGSAYLLIPTTLVIGVVLARRLHYRAAILLFSGFSGAALFCVGAKWFFGRRRPQLFPRLGEVTSDHSFPSSHATQCAAFWMSIILICWHLRPQWVRPAVVLGAILTLLTAASRIYLQVHFPTDVLAGVCLAVIWVTGLHAIIYFQKLSDGIVGRAG